MQWETTEFRHDALTETLDDLIRMETPDILDWVNDRIDEEKDEAWTYMGEDLQITHIKGRL